MRVIHFLELQEFAVRGPVERGLEYFYCHPQIGEFKKDWWPMDDDDKWRPVTAQAHSIITTSGLIVRNIPHMGNFAGYFSTNEWRQRDRQGWRSSMVEWHYATDSGLLRDERGYRGRNYLLDKNDLLRRGIRVDLTMKTLEA